jgi:hypothetical protein
MKKRGRPCAFTGPWLDLVKVCGGVKEAAEALNTKPRTLNRWATGENQPTGTAKLAILAAFYARDLVPPAL